MRDYEKAESVHAAEDLQQRPVPDASASHKSPANPLLHLQRNLGNQTVQHLVQRHFPTGRDGGSLEQEADRIAQQVVEPAQDSVLQPSPANHAESAVIPYSVHEVLGSPSQSIDPPVRKLMESRFGQDFRDVRVHTD